MKEHSEHLRMVEALLFASEKPLAEDEIATRLPEGADVPGHIETIRKFYSGRGVNLAKVGGRWMFRTAPDLAFLLRREMEETRRLSRAGVETLAIIAYHQPVTRAEIEEIRGVGLSKGTLDVLMEAGWIKPRGRRQTPGRPVTYGTTDEFLVHFGLEDLKDLPGFDELKAAGLLDTVDEALTAMEAAGQGQLDLEQDREEGNGEIDEADEPSVSSLSAPDKPDEDNPQEGGPEQDEKV